MLTLVYLFTKDLNRLDIAVPKAKKREEESHVHFCKSVGADSEGAVRLSSIGESGTESLNGGMNSYSQKKDLHPSAYNTHSSVSLERQHPVTISPAEKDNDSSRYYGKSESPYTAGRQILGCNGSSSSSRPIRHPYPSEEETGCDDKPANLKSDLNYESTKDRNIDSEDDPAMALEESFNAMLAAWYHSGYATGRYQALLEQSTKDNKCDRKNHSQQPSRQHHNQPTYPSHFDDTTKKK